MLPETHNKEEFLKKIGHILDYISTLNTVDIFPNMSKISELFLLCIQKLKEACTEELFPEKINRVFENIENYPGEPSNSNIATILFLKQIHYKNKNLDYSSEIKQSFTYLSGNLETIHFIFNIKINGILIFPIGKLLNYVINDDSFFNAPLNAASISTLLLALEIFDQADYKTEKREIDELIKKYNLRCLDFLKQPSTLKVGGDFGWKANLQQNGSLTLVILDDDKYGIYVRHNSKRYFDKLSQNVTLESEKNSNGEDIAYFCIIPLTKEYCFLSFDDLMQENERNLDIIEKLCFMLFNENNTNIFLENALVRIDGIIQPTNPCVSQDRFIILDDNTFCKSDGKSLTQKVLHKYLFYRIGEKFDFIMMSSIFYLLRENSAPIKQIFDLLKKCTNNIQSEVIKEWFNSINNLPDQINVIQDNYFASIKYIKSKIEIANKNFNDIRWLPYKFPEEIIPLYIKKNYILSDFSITKIHIEDDFEEIIYKDDDGNEISENQIKFIENETINNPDIFVIEREGNFFYFPEVDRLWKIQNKIKEENKGLVDASSFLDISDFELKQVISAMELHRSALCEDVCSDFSATAHFRLLNHLLYCNIPQKYKWNDFYKLFTRHQILKFSEIKKIVPELEKPSSLIIPKENSSTDNLLVSIFNAYVRSEKTRNRDIFNRRLIFNNNTNKFCSENGEEILEIIILFDTLQRGTSTKNVLQSYLNTDDNNEKCCIFYCNDRRVPVHEILDTNRIPLKIVAIYGSEYGKSVIDDYLKKGNQYERKANEIIVKKIINHIADSDFIQDAKKLYKNVNMEEKQYPIIREFNQPKMNIFPENLLKPSCVASIFVKKEEFRAHSFNE